MRGEPAGEPVLSPKRARLGDAASRQQQGSEGTLMNVIIESDRDRRTLEWLVSKVGTEGVREACLLIAGQRKLYVSNIANVLGFKPPDSVLYPTREDARARLAKLKELLKPK